MADEKGRSAARYAHMRRRREPYTAVAEAVAKLTIPSVFPTLAQREQPETQLKVVTETPWQNTGSRGVNNLAAKLLIALLPPNSPFFRLILADELREEIAADPKIENEVEKALTKMERRVMEEIEGIGLRTDTFEALRHLLVTGNYLVHVPPQGAIRGFDLGYYVCRRNRRGEILELIVREGVDRQSADPRVKKIITAEAIKENASVFLHTHIERTDVGTFKVRQEVCGRVVPGSEGTHPADRLPWLVLRFRKVEGEDYGRGLGEENIGDLKALESLTESIVKIAKAASMLRIGVKPGSMTSPNELSRSRDGDFFYGAEGDLWAFQINKNADASVAAQTAENIKNDLKFIFMLDSAVRREGERVTAEEIRRIAGELDDSLGGIFSILTQEFQLPLVQLMLARLQRAGTLPAVKSTDLKPVIVTGLEAIGRTQDANKLRGFVEDVAVVTQLDPTAVQIIDVKDILRRLAIARGVDDSVVKSNEQIQQEQAEAAQDQQGALLAGVGIQALGKGAEQAAVNAANSGASLPGGALSPQQ